MSPVPIISPRASVLDIFIHWFSFLLYVIIKAILHFFYRFLTAILRLTAYLLASRASFRSPSGLFFLNQA